MKRIVLLGIASFLLAAAASVYTPRAAPAAVAAMPVLASATALAHAEALTTPRGDGATPLLSVQVEPRAVRSSSQGESLEMEVIVSNGTTESLLAVYGVQFLSVDGMEVDSTPIAPHSSLPPKRAMRGSVASRPGLADGYYQVRATVLARGASGEIAEASEMYLVVEQGRIRPVDFDEWYARSGIESFGFPG